MSDQPEGVADDLVKELAKKAHDFDAVRKSVEDAASVSFTLWFSYLFALFYIGIAAGGVTHRDLLLENAVKLPVDLPLVAFFVAGADPVRHLTRLYVDAFRSAGGEGGNLQHRT